MDTDLSVSDDRRDKFLTDNQFWNFSIFFLEPCRANVHVPRMDFRRRIVRMEHNAQLAVLVLEKRMMANADQTAAFLQNRIVVALKCLLF